MKRTILTTALAVCLAQAASAAIVWTGGGDTTNFYDDANWNFGGSGSVTMANPTDDDVEITGATLTINGNVDIGNGFAITLDSASYTFGNNTGFRGIDDDATAANQSSGVTSVLNLNNGSYVSSQYVTVGLTVNIDSTSELYLRGTGDPLNSQSELSAVYLTTGGKLTLATLAEFSEQADTDGGSIYVNGVQVTGATLEDHFSFVDNGGSVTATAIPEPGSAALLGLASLGLIFRRRK